MYIFFKNKNQYNGIFVFYVFLLYLVVVGDDRYPMNGFPFYKNDEKKPQIEYVMDFY